MAGEEKLIGTGTTVWDASTVLVRYLQRAAIPLAGKRVVDLGSGTGECALQHPTLTVVRAQPPLWAVRAVQSIDYYRLIIID